MGSTTQPTGWPLLLASTLLWVWGVLNLLSAIAIGIPMVAGANVGGIGFSGAIAVAGVVLCICGRGVRRRRRGAAIGALVTSGALLILTLLTLTGWPLTLFFGIPVTILIFANWKHLETS